MVSNNLLARTVSKSYEVEEDGTFVLLNVWDGAFVITDLMISNKNSRIKLWLSDGINHFKILEMDEYEKKFNHAYSGGFQSWSGAKLVLEKESDEPSNVTIFINYVGRPNGLGWNIWSQRLFM